MSAAKLAMARVEVEGIRLGPVDASFEPMSFEDWSRKLQSICKVVQRSPWWIGALLHYGEGEWLNDQNEEEAKRKKRKWGTKYSMALQLTGLEYQTLKNCVYVYEKVELSRRRDKLSWSHHSEVAPLNPSEQEELLERAERENWTRSELREAVRQIKKSAPDEPEPSVGFVAEPCINELLRGFSSEIQRRGSVDRWPQPVRQAWRTALKPIIKLYEDLAA